MHGPLNVKIAVISSQTNRWMAGQTDGVNRSHSLFLHKEQLKMEGGMA